MMKMLQSAEGKFNLWRGGTPGTPPGVGLRSPWERVEDPSKPCLLSLDISHVPMKTWGQLPRRNVAIRRDGHYPRWGARCRKPCPSHSSDGRWIPPLTGEGIADPVQTHCPASADPVGAWGAREAEAGHEGQHVVRLEPEGHCDAQRQRGAHLLQDDRRQGGRENPPSHACLWGTTAAGQP